MGDKELSRRKVLSGLVATGGAGALAGRGTTALFSDEETFTGNSIKASGSTAGVVDISVDINSMDRGVEYEITLPDDESDLKNNPSYIWVRTTDCPGPGADALRVQLRFCGETILTGSAREVLDYLVSGVSLACPDSEACLVPGDTVSLQFDVIEVVGDNSFDSLDFDLEFTAQQCRYDAEPKNPFEDPEVNCNPDGQAISFVAFCPSDQNNIGKADVCISEILAKDGNGPTSLVWETTFDVEYITVKSGQNFTIYDYSESLPTKGIVSSDGNTAAEYSGTLSNKDLSDIDSNGESCLDTSTGDENSYSSDPCQLAADVFNKACPSRNTGVKLEDDDGELEPQQCEGVVDS
jgi:predicted ribosomally synthesized peptide with SipW-like signal peptide